jgi:hypothetical protein
MSDFLTTRHLLNAGDGWEVTCDLQANVLLLTDYNFKRYKRGESYQYVGCWAKEYPVVLCPPTSGFWNLVIDLAGRSGTIRHSSRIIRAT